MSIQLPNTTLGSLKKLGASTVSFEPQTTCFELHDGEWIKIAEMEKKLESFASLEWGDVYCRYKTDNSK